MPNRYSRDELIKIALQMAQLPNLDIHDIPGGVVQPDAFSIQWLQDILDFWYHMVPFSSTVMSATLNMSANSNVVVAPTDFILDVRNGYLVQTISSDSLSYKRMYRLPFQKWLNRSLMSQKSTNVQYPSVYCVIGKSGGTQIIRVSPTPTQAVLGTLWYYQLPPTLTSSDIPTFPNDYVITEYIRIRALEWARIFDPGTAQRFCEKMVAGMKSAGLMNEPEDDEIPFDDLVYRRQPTSGLYTTYSWMGER